MWGRDVFEMFECLKRLNCFECLKLIGVEGWDGGMAVHAWARWGGKAAATEVTGGRERSGGSNTQDWSQQVRLATKRDGSRVFEWSFEALNHTGMPA